MRFGIIMSMKSSGTNSQSVHSRLAKRPDKQAIIRAVASSTAIETGQSIAQIERTLRQNNNKFRHLTLAR